MSVDETHGKKNEETAKRRTKERRNDSYKVREMVLCAHCVSISLFSPLTRTRVFYACGPAESPKERLKARK